MTTHIVIGAGPSGIFLSNKLLERDNVILIEQGSNDLFDVKKIETIIDPSKWYSSHKSSYSTLYHSCSQKYLGNRCILYQQGLGIGGTSNINAMLLTGGSPKVYDLKWPKSWNSNRFNELFKTVRSIIQPFQNKTNLQVLTGMENDNDCSEIDDLMDRNSVRSSYHAVISSNQRILLGKVLNSSNTNKKGKLEVIPNSKAVKILFDPSNKAIGVVINSQDNQSRTVYCTGNNAEVILCAGVFESPKVLMNSINHKTDLADHLVSGNYDLLKSIGNNLQDHIHISLAMFGNWKLLFK